VVGEGLCSDDFGAGGASGIFGYSLSADELFIGGNGDILWETDLREFGIEVVGRGFKEDGARRIQDLSYEIGTFQKG